MHPAKTGHRHRARPLRGYKLTALIDRQLSVPRQVYDLLRDRIQSAELKPGESINERWLAEWLGVSRTPIREAVRRLAGDGLIEIIPNVGTSVALVDPRRVYEFCMIRISLECAAIEEAVGNFTPAAGRQLERLIEEQDETVSNGDNLRNISVDSEFHKFIIGLSGFSTVPEIMNRVMGEIIRARHLSIKLPGRLRQPIVEHQAILEALRSGDPKRCASAMRSHLELSISSIMQVMKTNPEFLAPARKP